MTKTNLQIPFGTDITKLTYHRTTLDEIAKDAREKGIAKISYHAVAIEGTPIGIIQKDEKLVYDRTQRGSHAYYFNLTNGKESMYAEFIPDPCEEGIFSKVLITAIEKKAVFEIAGIIDPTSNEKHTIQISRLRCEGIYFDQAEIFYKRPADEHSMQFSS